MAVYELEVILALTKKAFEEGLKGAGKDFDTFGKKLGKAVGTTAKITAAAVGAASTAVGVLVKKSIDAYGEFEQLVGGTQLMYGDAFDFVMDKAKNAYKTVQMSQAEYLRQSNGLAISLKNALLQQKAYKGNSEAAGQAAAELADRVITAEADIVAATGVNQDTVQNAFNAVIRGQFQTLDSLGIGIKGSQAGMEAVIKQVNEWNRANGKATQYSMKNTADIMNALVDYVEMQGLAGYASMEAADTIQGSLATMKASWQDLLVGLSDPDANLQQLMTNFVDSAKQAADKILPVAQTAVQGITELITDSADTLVPLIDEYVASNAGTLVSAGAKLLVALITGLVQAAPQIVAQIPGIVADIKQAFIDNKDALKEAGSELLRMLGEGAKAAFDWAWRLGEQVVADIKDGIASAWDDLVSWFQGIFNAVFGHLTASISLSASAEGGPTYIPHNAIGLDYVPHNDYYARLHQGEAVLTRSEAEMWRRGQPSGGGVTINQYMQEIVRTPAEHASATLAYFEQARWAM